ncbi:MAG: hypothetical protein ACRC5F_03470 [Cetobacterium sp.]
MIINGETINRETKRTEDKHEETVSFEFEEPEQEEDCPNMIFTKIGNDIYVNNLGLETKFTAFKRTFFKEAFPDFADKEELIELLIPAGRTKLVEAEKDRVVEITLDNVYVLEFKGTYYFATISALKEYMIDTGLSLPTKPDGKLKELILEKSLYLKKKFGLTEDETQNHEMYPVFKRLTILYCLKELVAYGFIQGEATSNDGSVQPTSTNSLTLGKFSTKNGSGSSGSGGSGSTDSGFLPDIINSQIAVAEDDVRKSIFLKSDKVYWFKKQGGVNNG